MKLRRRVKYHLSWLGLWPKIDAIRGLPGACNWIANGYSGLPPEPIKRSVLSGYLRGFQLRRFIETGTFVGDTLAYIAHDEDGPHPPPALTGS